VSENTHPVVAFGDHGCPCFRPLRISNIISVYKHCLYAYMTTCASPSGVVHRYMPVDNTSRCEKIRRLYMSIQWRAVLYIYIYCSSVTSIHVGSRIIRLTTCKSFLTFEVTELLKRRVLIEYSPSFRGSRRASEYHLTRRIRLNEVWMKKSARWALSFCSVLYFET